LSFSFKIFTLLTTVISVGPYILTKFSTFLDQNLNTFESIVSKTKYFKVDIFFCGNNFNKEGGRYDISILFFSI
jgi:hypothetical protein